ncbi:pentapeptide repeat-containing protein [Labrenzia sp. CE80]|uniref:pentapeptide repeat-containing protein n=1 Tax=Labrenzia sp. CE80 TaxID=1788986 RepID=UPI00129BF96C|nr:pentapeptide repeat-containing protein [Labrenzia sp. CE80]
MADKVLQDLLRFSVEAWNDARMLGSVGLPIDLTGVQLQGANLQGANLQGANLQGANLQGANLQGANLQGANLQGANLQGADLQGANLQGANLQGTNFQGAYLKGANLQGANLQSANLRDADFMDTHFSETYRVIGTSPTGDPTGVYIPEAGRETELGLEPGLESIKRMLYFTKREAEKEGRTFCAYLIDLSIQSLYDLSEEESEALRSELKLLVPPDPKPPR